MWMWMWCGVVWEQHDATHVRPGRVQHIFINCSQFAMHDINTKAKRGYEASKRARARARDMSKIMTQRIIAIKRETRRRARQEYGTNDVPCALWLL